MAVNEDIRRNGANGDRDAGLSRVYGVAPREEPPARLDAAILAAARREVGAGPRRLAGLRTWRVPVSIAAVVVLSVSLVTLVREEGGEELYRPVPQDLPRPAEPAPQPSKSIAEPAAPAQPSVEQDVPRAAAPARAPQAADPAVSRRAQEIGPGQPPEATSRPQPQPFQGAPASAGERPAAPPSPGDDRARAAEAPPDRSPAPIGALDRGPAAVMSAPPVEAPAGAAAEARRAAPPRAKAYRNERDMPAREDGAGRGAAGSAASAPKAAETRPAPGALMRDMGAPVRQQPATAIMKELDGQPPEKWLERIQALRREGQQAEAHEVLAEFKRRYPGHPLPPELQ